MYREYNVVGEFPAIPPEAFRFRPRREYSPQ
jgi:hypothetical protein